MKTILSLCLIATLIVAGAAAKSVPVTGCSVKVPVTNETASLQYFVGNTTVGASTFDVNFCEIQNLTGCNEEGYIAEYVAGKCVKVYNNRVSASFENGTFALVFSYTKDHSFSVSADTSLKVDIKCIPGLDSMEGRMKDGTLVYSSGTVCAGYSPNPTTQAPPTPEPTTAVPPTPVPTTPTPEGNFTVDGCNMTFNGQTADLKFFTGNATVNGNQSVGVYPCGKHTFARCGGKSGYIATYKANGQCDRVYDVKLPTTFDSTNIQFTTEYLSTFQSVWDIARTEDDNDSLYLIVRCKVGDDQLDGKREGNKLIFESETVCYNYNPNETPAPEEPESKGLSTGVIVGIIIAVVAVLIVIGVIIRIKTGGDDKDGDYERV